MKRLLKIWRKLGRRKKAPPKDEDLGQYEDLLVDRIDPDYGLLGRLRSCKALSPAEVDKIRVQSTYRERNVKLIQCISTGGRFNEFVSALRSADQSHIANYLEAHGDYGDFNGDDWPLTEDYISILETNKESLVDLIDLGSSGLLQGLYAKGVINARQRDALLAVRVPFEANDCFLEILRRRSIADYAKTIDCLRETNQGHVAKTLDDGGAIVPVHANIITGTAQEIETAELRIVSLCHLILDRLPDTSAEETQEILENVRLHIIAIKKGNSLVLYVRCRALEDLNRLERLLISEEINVVIKAMIVRVLPSFRQLKLTTYSLEEDLKRAERYFQALKTRQTDSIELCKENAELYDLPLELLDMILKKSYLCSVIRENRRERRNQSDSADKNIIERLAMVSYLWLQRVIKTRFKNAVWSNLSKYYRKTMRNSSFYKSNRPYIEENLELNSLLRSLKSDDLLNDVETACVKRKRYLAGKGNQPIGLSSSSPNLLDFERLLRDVGREPLIRALWNSGGQKSMARIFEDGGVVVRAEFQNSDTFNKRPWSREISRQPDPTKSRTNSADLAASGQLTNADLEVLKAVEDRGTAAWIWCRSANALSALSQTQNVNELLQQMDSLIEIMEEKHAKFKRVDVDIDRDQLEKELVLLSSVIQFTSRLDLEEKCLVYGVTKLMQRIHVICRGIFSSCSLPSPILYVFEDDDPFRLVDQVDLNEISCPLDIASGAEENCLYVLDSWTEGNNCLWKIEENGDGRNNVVTRWLEFDEEGFRPATLSVSGDGLVLVVSRNRDGPNQPALLRLYGPPRAELLLTLSLPRDVRDPVHAVRASTGNFLIIHQLYAAVDPAGHGNYDGAARREQKQEDEDNDDYNSEEETKAEERDDDIEGQEPGARRDRDDRTSISVVSEVSSDGASVVRRFCPKSEDQRLNISLYYDGGYFCVDSKGRVYVSDTWNHRVIVLDADLRWNRVLVPSKWIMHGRDGRAVLLRPWKLFYDEEKSQVVVGGGREVVVCSLRRS